MTFLSYRQCFHWNVKTLHKYLFYSLPQVIWFCAYQKPRGVHFVPQAVFINFRTCLQLISVSVFRKLQAQDTHRRWMEIISNLLLNILYRFLAFIQPHMWKCRFEHLILIFVYIIQIRIRMLYLVREHDMYMTSIRILTFFWPCISVYLSQ